MSASLQTRPAGASDEALLLAMMRDFYTEDRIMFEPVRVTAALHELLADPACGTVLLLGDGATTGGYLTLTRGFSLEHGGRFALLDELYLAPDVRGRGWGGDALTAAITLARSWNVASLRLEVHHHNPRAKALYARRGFVDDHRDMLSFDLAAA